jgi:hypothetical protein
MPSYKHCQYEANGLGELYKDLAGVAFGDASSLLPKLVSKLVSKHVYRCPNVAVDDLRLKLKFISHDALMT